MIKVFEADNFSSPCPSIVNSITAPVSHGITRIFLEIESICGLNCININGSTIKLPSDWNGPVYCPLDAEFNANHGFITVHSIEMSNKSRYTLRFIYKLTIDPGELLASGNAMQAIDIIVENNIGQFDSTIMQIDLHKGTHNLLHGHLTSRDSETTIIGNVLTGKFLAYNTTSVSLYAFAAAYAKTFNEEEINNETDPYSLSFNHKIIFVPQSANGTSHALLLDYNPGTGVLTHKDQPFGTLLLYQTGKDTGQYIYTSHPGSKPHGQLQISYTIHYEEGDRVSAMLNIAVETLKPGITFITDPDHFTINSNEQPSWNHAPNWQNDLTQTRSPSTPNPAPEIDNTLPL